MTSTLNKPTTSSKSSDGIVLQGYIKKLKTMKKKYFVLYEKRGEGAARLEYYDSEKKYKSKSTPKRTILFSSCININRRLDTKHEFVVVLATREGGFDIIFDTEEEMNDWLEPMVKLQRSQLTLSNQPKPFYEHVWQVEVQRKGLAEKYGILGSYHVCLSLKSVTFIRIGAERTNFSETRIALIEFFLTSIRRCGDSKCYFYMEVGRQSALGAGELWMETRDSLIAQNMHTMILNVMSSKPDESFGPMRKRSSSATETSKPMAILQRRQTHSGKIINCSPSSATNRDRCDSLPSTRNRTNMDGGFSDISLAPSKIMSSSSNVPNIIFNRHTNSPPIDNAISPVGYSESEGSTLSIDEPDSIKHSHTPDDNSGFVSSFHNSRSPGGVIPEENSDEFWYTERTKSNCPEIVANDNITKKLRLSSSNVYSEDSESQYLDMGHSTSPSDITLGASDNPLSSGGHSRTSSLAEVVEGYVYMSSPQPTDYVNVNQTVKNKGQMHLGSSAGSSNSEGALKNMSFAEYSAEKNNTNIIWDGDQVQELCERPPRAYSVGSRVEHNNQKMKIEYLGDPTQSSSRVRAFSVGSRSKVPRCDLQRSILKSANSSSSNNSNITNSKSSVSSLDPMPENKTKGVKSSSAPLLIHKSQNSVDRMDDLMEIDFSQNSSSRSSSLTSQTAGTSYKSSFLKGLYQRSNPLVSSKDKNPISKKSNDKLSESVESKADSGYLEMRPVIYAHTPSQGSRHESIDRLIVPKDNFTTNKEDPSEGYLEMTWSGDKELDPNINSDESCNTGANSQSQLTEKNEKNKLNNITSTHSEIPNQSLTSNKTSTGVNIPKQQLSGHLVQDQSPPLNQKRTLVISESNPRKRFFDRVNNSSTISEERNIIEDEDVNICSKKLENMSIESSSPNDNDTTPDVNVNLPTANSDCSDYINFPIEFSVPKNTDVVETVPDCQQNIWTKPIAKTTSSQSLEEKHLNNFIPNNCTGCNLHSSHRIDSIKDDGKNASLNINSTRYISSSNSENVCNANRQHKDSNIGYELLHIHSDSSLQTRKNLSRPNSVNSERYFSVDSNNCRSSSVNNDCSIHNSISSTVGSHYDRSQNMSSPLVSSSTNNTYSMQNRETIMNAALRPVPQQMELHYASLDLPVNSHKNSNDLYGSIVNTSRSSISDCSPANLSPNSNTSQQSTFIYAKIDFKQCENKKLKCSTQHNL